MIDTDIFGRSAALLNRKPVFLLDMDGTLYNEERLFPGVSAFLEHLHGRGIKHFYLTNNSSKSSAAYVAKLKRLGIEARPREIISSTHVAAHYAIRKHGKGLVYVVGTKSMVRELKRLGVNVTTEIQADIVAIIVGNDNQLTFPKLRDASYLLTNGVDFIATNIDRACPVSFGFVPDCGGICTMLTYATGRRPTYMGKPQAALVNYVKALTHTAASDIVMVGDRLYTDMLMAVKRHMTAVCLLSGEATLEDIKRYPHTLDYVFENIQSLYEAMKASL